MQIYLLILRFAQVARIYPSTILLAAKITTNAMELLLLPPVDLDQIVNMTRHTDMAFIPK
jgi:hypothetical protein